jgi:hypothetical protein
MTCHNLRAISEFFINYGFAYVDLSVLPSAYKLTQCLQLVL